MSIVSTSGATPYHLSEYLAGPTGFSYGNPPHYFKNYADSV
jgi:hypothetical protein